MKNKLVAVLLGGAVRDKRQMKHISVMWVPDDVDLYETKEKWEEK